MVDSPSEEEVSGVVGGGEALPSVEGKRGLL